MIDLEFDALPDTIVVDGEDVKVRTSFRLWLRFGRLLRDERVADPSVLVEPCGGDWVPAAVEFYLSENATPRMRGGGDADAIDLALDGDYVVGSFQQAYGIDLTEGDMHWHRFLALLRSLPQGCKLTDIAGYRSWRKGGPSHDAAMRRLRDEWSLPANGSRGQSISADAQAFLDANGERLRRRLEGVDA